MEFVGVAPSPRLRPDLFNDLASALSHSLATEPHSAEPLFWSIDGAARSGKSSLLLNLADQPLTGADRTRLILINGRGQVNSFRKELVLARTAFQERLVPFSKVDIRTFHSLAFYILQLSGELTNSSATLELISSSEQESLLGEAIAALASTDEGIHPDLRRASTTSAFRREIRDFILRASEEGISPAHLHQLSLSSHEPYWSMIAEIWRQYRLLAAANQNQRLRLDSAELVVNAFAALKNSEELSNRLRKEFPILLIDNFQECTLLQRELITLLAPELVVVASDAGSAVNRFRGADPDSLDQYLTARNPKQISLTAAGEIVEPSYFLANSEAELANQVIAQCWRSHYEEGVAWRDMAIIARSLASYPALFKRAALLQGVPLIVEGEQSTLAQNSFIQLIALLPRLKGQLAVSDLSWIEKLLLSPLIDGDVAAIRRSKSYLLSERTSGTIGSIDEDFLTLLIGNEPIAPQHGQYVRNFRQLRDLVHEVASKTSNAITFFALLWPQLHLANGHLVERELFERALAGGRDGSIADRDLDAVMSLLARMERDCAREPGLSIDEFFARVGAEDVPSDSLAATGEIASAVTFTTVHSAAGSTWREVTLIGLNKGEWPNLRNRSTLLGGERLLEFVRTGLNFREELAASMSSALAKDERRLFEVAKSRAAETLSLWAIVNNETAPSTYFRRDLAERAAEKSGTDGHSFIAQLRKIFESEIEGSEFAGKLLLTAAAAQIEGANPQEWLGAAPISSALPLAIEDEPRRISPSAIERFDECQLKWLYQKFGLSNGDQYSQLLGISIHKLAEFLALDPTLTLPQLQKRLADNWRLIDNSTGWFKDQNLANANEILARLFDWIVSNQRDFVASEAKFNFKESGVEVSGSIDRIEISQSGELVIVDFKTGKTVLGKERANEDGQLALYRMAAVLGAITSEQAGAKLAEFIDHPERVSGELIYPAKNPIELRRQSSQDLAVIKQRLFDIGPKIGGANFLAIPTSSCDRCDYRFACPTQVEGKAVIDE